MTYAGWTPSRPVLDSETGASPTGDAEDVLPKLLIVVERRALVRGFLAHWIGTLHPGSEVIGVADAEAGLMPAAVARASLVVLGASAGELSDAWFDRQVAALRSSRIDVPLAAIVDADGARIAIERARDGDLVLQGYILTSSSTAVAAAALHLVAAGGVYLPPSGGKHGIAEQTAPLGLMQREGASALGARLTPRERAVLDFLQQGMANKIIAYRLGLSQSTVKAHVHSIISKLNVRNRTEAAMSSYRPAMPPSAPALPMTRP